MNANKAKGDRAEAATRDYLRAHGFPGVERTRAGYQRDAGDLHLAPGVIAQVKDWGSPAWSEWLVQLAEQIDEAGAEVGTLVVKRRGKGDAGQWLAVMPVSAWAELVRRAGYGSPMETGEVA